MRLVRVVEELAGLLVFKTGAPGPPNAPPVLQDPLVLGGPIRSEGGAYAEGRFWDDTVDTGRFGLEEAAVVGLLPVPAPSDWNSSPSSEAISVMREDMILGAWEREVVNGVGKELLAGERVEDGERGRSMVEVRASNEKYSAEYPWNREEHS